MPRGSKPGERRGGRAKGTPNKLTASLKDMILQALAGAGGIAYLQEQASKNPNAFLALVGRVLPLQVQGDKDNPLAVETRVVHELHGATPKVDIAVPVRHEIVSS